MWSPVTPLGLEVGAFTECLKQNKTKKWSRKQKTPLVPSWRWPMPGLYLLWHHLAGVLGNIIRWQEGKCGLSTQPSAGRAGIGHRFWFFVFFLHFVYLTGVQWLLSKCFLSCWASYFIPRFSVRKIKPLEAFFFLYLLAFSSSQSGFFKQKENLRN